MEKMEKITTVLRLVLPLVGTAGGFFTSTWMVAVIVWCLSLAAIIINVRLEFTDGNKDNSFPVFLLTLANIWVLGVVAIPIACLYCIYKALEWIVKRLGLFVWSHRKALKNFFILLFLNLAVWGLVFTRTQIEDIWTSVAAYIVCLAVFGFSLRESIPLFRRNQDHRCYLVINTMILLFSVCAALTAFIWPELVSLNWGGLMLVLWLELIMATMLVISVLLWLITSIISLFR